MPACGIPRIFMAEWENSGLLPWTGVAAVFPGLAVYPEMAADRREMQTDAQQDG